MSLPALLFQVGYLASLSGIERARKARALSDVALAELAAAGDAGVWEATRSASYADVAAALGVSKAAIGKAISRHNARN